MKTGVFTLAGLLLLSIAFGTQPALGEQQQPLPYSHKAHIALGLQCKSCHSNPDPGELMRFPAESFCMGCHRTVKADSPHIQKLAAAAKEKKPLPWVRVYKIPDYVYFSHRVHTQAGATCETCHGPVSQREVITKEVEHTMQSCMACHGAHNAPNDCDSCHASK
ncbi:MAG: cytochrome c3 family protein [Bryobacterales bacterium]|nr:cytochrome c3 family protein [Bryobacterales bacterium]